jgi:hypothetical protein
MRVVSGRAASRSALAVRTLAMIVACSCHKPVGSVGTTDAAVADGARDAAEEAGRSNLEAGPADDEMPASDSDELKERARHLLEAIAKDDRDLATDILFPRDGWLATRDVDDPGKDWAKRVDVPFRKALHRLSRHQKGLDRAQFVSFDPGHTIVQATPKRHGYKKALWVLLGARISFVVDGRTRTMSIREMTAWRGAWYVTRLR